MKLNFNLGKPSKKNDVRTKIDLLNKNLIKYTKKNITINQDIIVLLNKISESINSIYGLTHDGNPKINTGNCAVFANEFFMLWNSRFINEVKFGFLSRINLSHPFHVFVKLPNNQLFDGGRGVHQVNTYNKKILN